MMKFVKKLTSAVLAVMLAVTAVIPVTNKVQKIEAIAYSDAQRFVDTARAYSYISGRPNETHYYYGVSEGDWCAFFCGYIAYRCGFDGFIPKLSYCDNQYGISGYRSYYQSQGKFVKRREAMPSMGDFIIFDWDGDGYGDHIGIVTGVDVPNGLIYDIEGNVGDNVVAEKQYHFTDPEIIGYCKVFDDYNTQIPTPSDPVAPSTPTYNTTEKINNWQLTSPIGGWLRATPYYGTKLGVISTGTVLYGNYTKNQGGWVYVKSAMTESGYVFDGYVYRANLTPIPESGITPIPVTTTTTVATTTVTTTTTTVASSEKSTESSTKASEIESSTITTAPTSEVPETTTVVTENPNPENTQPPCESEYTPNYYVSSLIGANARASALISDNNILGIIDTDERLYVADFEGEFAHCRVESTGQWVYLHRSTIDCLPPKDYTYGARISHYVSSDIGCNFRAKGDYAGDVLCILDTNQQVSVLTEPNELGFVYCELTLGDGVVHNGYIHIDGLSAF